MSTPINPSSIMLYKIMKDYEETGREKLYFIPELDFFAKKVIENINSNTNEDLWILPSPEIKEDLSRLCDVTDSFCRLNEDKFKNGGELFAKRKIGLMPYNWLKASMVTLKQFNDEKAQIKNASVSILHGENGDKFVSAICWDKGPIIIDGEEECITK